MQNYLKMPTRSNKPREKGLTILLDTGHPLGYFTDIIENMHPLIDFIKFGWGTAIVNENFLEKKIRILKQYDIEYFFGGTLFEKFLFQNKLDNYKKFLHSYHCKNIEISNGSLSISNHEKCIYIEEFAKDYTVFSEVGSKNSILSEKMSTKTWINSIMEDYEHGSSKVILEARESGTVGIYHNDGTIKSTLFDELIKAGMPMNKIIFEAPHKEQQAYIIKKLGPNCNLANISFSDLTALETLRLGLRYETFTTFEE